jgi:EF-P beta-lysylation protein EpmB
LPQARESLEVDGYISEPLLEQDFSPVPGLIHKYRSRALLILTQACAIHCRYCFRRNFPYNEHQQSRSEWSGALAYIASHPQINEVILSGGDPLSVSDSALDELLQQIDQIPTVVRIRIHTRMLPSLPQRITKPLLNSFSALRCKIILVAHCNHPNELADDTEFAFQQLKQHGVTLLNQSVLLHQVNDDPRTLARLSERLFEQGVLPYYLFTLDKVAGAAHFDLNRQEAKQIYQKLSALLPGFLTPKLAEEQPGEQSKRVLSNT